MADDLKPVSKEDLLLEEYKGLIPQIIHWDSHFWNKSKFFLTFESAFLAGALVALNDFARHGTKVPMPMLFALFAATIFSLYLSYVWFRTNRRNREYLELRFKRAREIEAALGSVQSLFTNDPLLLPKDHGSSGWETHLPIAFGIAWIATLIGALFLGRC